MKRAERWLFLGALALAVPVGALPRHVIATPLRGPDLLAALRAAGHEVVARGGLKQWREFAATPAGR